jgi:hypothetical protein
MNAPNPIPRHLIPGVQEVLKVARCYARLIEAAGPDRPCWLMEVSVLLPRLHAAMASIHCLAPHADHDQSADLDARFEVFSRLRLLLDDRDGYFLEFDHAHEGVDAMTGSLADDLTDIYCELKSGLLAFDADPARVLDIWSLGFDGHWGQHLVDAQRHLVNLAAANRLGAGCGAD